MTRLNYQYDVIAEKTIDDRLFLEVKDSIYNKVIYMELYKELDASNWDLNSKTEDELSNLKYNKEIHDYFIHDNFALDIKTFYKVFENLDFNDEVKTYLNLINKESDGEKLSNRKEGIKKTPSSFTKKDKKSLIDKAIKKRRISNKKANKQVKPLSILVFIVVFFVIAKYIASTYFGLSF